MFIVTHRKIFFTLSALLVLGSIFAIFTYGFHLGIDFKGGSVLELEFPNGRPDISTIQLEVSPIGLEDLSVSPMGANGVAIKALNITSDEKTQIEQALRAGGAEVDEIQSSTIGPSASAELAHKASIAIGVVILCIVLFIMFAFRKLKHSLNYGLATIIALAHDVLIPTGVYVVWTHFFGGEVDLLFVTALLAILGYSVHDTIVVFDRVRENLLKRGGEAKGTEFESVVGASVNQTFGRSINTSLTIFLVLLALYFIGGETTHSFAFVLLIGIVAGTYSSIFVASPLLVTLEGWRTKGK